MAGELLACAQEVRRLTATPPLPKLVVLLPLKNTLSDAVSEFTNRLYDLGSEDEKLGGKESDFTSIEIDGVLRGLPLSNQEFLAAVAIAPFPLTRAEYAALAQAAKAADAECAALLESPLFAEISGEMPVCAEIRERMRAPLAPEADAWSEAAAPCLRRAAGTAARRGHRTVCPCRRPEAGRKAGQAPRGRP